eukprot:NODE_99_length_20465_cov_0.827654.p12 type:complete len:186 gc:universal NODE_99_length_20465_cov_0.827654:4292-3735(-)
MMIVISLFMAILIKPDTCSQFKLNFHDKLQIKTTQKIIEANYEEPIPFVDTILHDLQYDLLAAIYGDQDAIYKIAQFVGNIPLIQQVAHQLQNAPPNVLKKRECKNKVPLIATGVVYIAAVILLLFTHKQETNSQTQLYDASLGAIAGSTIVYFICVIEGWIPPIVKNQLPSKSPEVLDDLSTKV